VNGAVTHPAEGSVGAIGDRPEDPVTDATILRKVLGSFVTGVTVVTALDSDGDRLGITVNSFSSVSLDPPLISWSQSITAPSHPRFKEAQRFAINILAADQLDVSQRFAGRAGAKYEGLEHDVGLCGVPLIRGAVAYLECSMVAQHAGGDHVIFIGQVNKCSQITRSPLLFGHGRYLLAYPHYTNADIGEDEAEQRAIRVALPLVDKLSQECDIAVGIGVWGNLGPTIIHWSDISRSVAGRLRMGTVIPVMSSAGGRVFAAFLPPELTSTAIAGECALGGDGRQVRMDFERVLDEVRERKMSRIVNSLDFMDLYGDAVTAVAAPVFDRSGSLVLSLTATGYSGHFEPEWDAQVPVRLREVASQISEALGYSEHATA
jgi:flavin reductase (DIM6/NTAB) family NADH-FMN oxidoreductase RutF